MWRISLKRLTDQALWLVLVLTGLLAGCASVKFEGTETALDVTPRLAAEAGASLQGTVVWGGRIVAIQNLEYGTEFQVLAVPLNGSNVPQVDEVSTGRFIALFDGFLEPQDYAPGRFVTLAGQLDGTVEGSVGDAPVRFALVRTSQVHLWPRDVSRWDPAWNIGVGVGINL